MLSYIKTYGEFISDITHGKIVDEILSCSHRNFSPSEKRAFRNSLGAVNNALHTISIPLDVQVGIEYKVPLTNKRIDFMIAGEDENHNKNIVIVELKQWELVKHTDMSDIVLLGSQQHVHPSWQAYSYGTTLTNFNEYVEDNNVHISTCTFLHDYQDEYVGEIRNSVYKEGLSKAPAFISDEWTEFAQFIKTKVCKKCDVNLLYEMTEGKIKPSEFLIETLSKSLAGNPDIELIDQQRVAKSNIVKEVTSALTNSTRKRKVIIVKGGAGTGKSLIALQILGELHQKGYTAFYVAKSSYIKESYCKTLTRNIPNYKILRTLFRGSGEFRNEGYNTDKQFDCLLVDEAHRLTKRTKVSFMFYGENQIKEIIHASKTSVFFIDETQQIDIKDYGTIENIKAAALEENAEIIEDDRFVLQSQFRCNGSDEYISWVESVLYNKTFISGQSTDYDIKIFDDLVEMHNEIRSKNANSHNPSRMLSGDVFPWLSMKDKKAIDIVIGDYSAQWNMSKCFAVDPSSIDEVGCIHTCQGMEFEYAGLIIGDDLIYRNGKVETDYTKHPKKSGEYRRPHQRNIKPEDKELIDKLIRNTYKVLFTRGQKGLYLYIMDKDLKEYMKKRIKDLKQF